MIGTKVKLSPADHGRRMPLKIFEPAAWQEGHLYELARGIVVVSEVPGYAHAMQLEVLRDHLRDYKREHPETIHAVLGNMDCKLLVPELESERHPDLAVYLSRPALTRGRKVWRVWVPDLVIEVVSASSIDRDYVEKREEYWTLGAKEYWIVDAERRQVLALRRGRGRWTETVLGPENHLETKLLPGFRLRCGEVFAAAEEK